MASDQPLASFMLMVSNKQPGGHYDLLCNKILYLLITEMIG